MAKDNKLLLVWKDILFFTYCVLICTDVLFTGHVPIRLTSLAQTSVLKYRNHSHKNYLKAQLRLVIL